jgi:hypothetical protein
MAGAMLMPDYRLYCLDGDGKFLTVHEIDAANDADALSKAGQINIPFKCELWQRGRKVAVLDLHGGLMEFCPKGALLRCRSSNPGGLETGTPSAGAGPTGSILAAAPDG